MNNLFFQLRNICKHNRDGSESTKDSRLDNLELCANQLIDMGYRVMNATSLKQKHVTALVNRWLGEGLAAGTIKNRMSHLRWWAEKIGKTNVVLSNADYEIPNVVHTGDVSKARDLDEQKLSQITDVFVVASLRLQEAFGLRREEAIKFIPDYADQGDYIQLKASWCKGGRARELPIRTDLQRQALDYAKNIAGNGSLIPNHLKYYQQRGHYEKATIKVGLNNMHGLRHRYAQQRYQELTGWPCPHCGRPKTPELSEEQKRVDEKARLIISKELGHNRLAIVATYCGSR
jgi:site-specific recombinase XerC